MSSILLEDVVGTTLVAVFEEGSDKPVKWTGKFAQCDTPTSNGRKYSRKLWENILSRSDVQQKLDAGMIGVLNHPANGETDLYRSAIATKKLTIESDGSITGEAVIIPILGGEILRQLISAGIKVGVSSRGRGSVDEEGNVNEDYTLVAFDVVDNPAVPSAIPSVSESKNSQNSSIKPNNRRSGMSGYDRYYVIEGSIRPTLKAIESGNIDEKLKDPLDAVLRSALKEIGEFATDESANLMTPLIAALQSRIMKCRELLENFSKAPVGTPAKDEDGKVQSAVDESKSDVSKVMEVSLSALKDVEVKKPAIEDKAGSPKLTIEEMDLASLKVHAKELEGFVEDLEAKHTEAIAALEELKNQYAKAAVDEAIEKAFKDHPELVEAKDFFEGVDSVEGVATMVERLSKLAGKDGIAKGKTDEGKELPKSGSNADKPVKKETQVATTEELARSNCAGNHQALFEAMDVNYKK